MEEISPEILDYFRKTEEAFNSSSISVDDLNAFILAENKHLYHRNPKYSEFYVKLFTIFRDRILVPNGGKIELLGIFENYAVIYKLSGVKIPNNPNIFINANQLLSSLHHNQNIWKFRIIRMAMVLHVFNNSDWSDEFLKRTFDIPPSDCFESIDEAKSIALLYRIYFKDCSNLMKLLEKNVYDDSFYNKEINVQKSNFMWVMEFIWGLVFLYSNDFQDIMPRWFEMFEEAMEKCDKETVLYMHLPLSHVHLNLCDTQEAFKEFNDKVEMPLCKYIQKNMRKWGVKKSKKKNVNKEKTKIGFVYDRIVPNSPTKLLVSLLTYLKENSDMELYVYDMAYIEKAHSDEKMVKEIRDMGVNYVSNQNLIDDAYLRHYYNQFNKANALRNQVLDDEIDILVMMGNRLSSGFMFAARTAPMQIFWDHGNHEYNIKNIDKRICHFDDKYRNDFEFERFELKMLDKYLQGIEEENMQKAAKIKELLPEHEVVMGSIGRLMKLSEEYLKTVKSILDKYPESVYLACGPGNKEELSKAAQSVGMDMNRFLMTGFVDPQIYGYVIDIYLNTFPLVGGESVNEFLAKGEDKYVINLQN